MLCCAVLRPPAPEPAAQPCTVPSVPRNAAIVHATVRLLACLLLLQLSLLGSCSLCLVTCACVALLRCSTCEHSTPPEQGALCFVLHTVCLSCELVAQ